MAPDDPIVLTYRDAKLISSDLAKLRGTDYLSDSIIHFFFSHLSSSCPKDILLVKPAESFWLANSGDLEADFRDFAENNQFGEKQVVIFTVNDNQDMSQYDGGNHWSLLVYYRKPNAFVHYDSVGGLNNLVARKFYGAIKTAAAARQTPIQTPMRSPPTRSLISKKHLRRPVRNCHHKNKKKKKKTISGAFVMMGRTFSNKLHQFRKYHKDVVIRCHKKYLRQYTKYHPIKNIVRATDTAWNKLVSSVMQNYLTNNNGDDDDDEDTSTSDNKDDDNDPWFREESVMPQQTNCYDCGLYVMSVARVICQWYSQQEERQQNFCFLGDDRFPNIMKHLDNSVEHTMRPELLNLIYSKAS